MHARRHDVLRTHDRTGPRSLSCLRSYGSFLLMPHAMATSATKKHDPVSTAVCMSMVTRDEAVYISASAKALWYLYAPMTKASPLAR